MKVFLLWRSKKGPGPELEGIGPRLLSRFSPLFDEPPTVMTRDLPGARLAVLDIPIDGWRSPVEQEDKLRWVMAIDPAVNARSALTKNGIVSTKETRLLTLAAELETNHRAIVRELAPPAALLWENRQTRTVHLVNDGLGHAQLFEYEDDDLWVITNRVTALTALGIDLEPVPEDWATRFTLGWFPLSSTGFQRTETVRGGTHLCIGPGGVSREEHDVLHEWVHPDPMNREEALELGCASLVEMCDDAIDQWERPSVGLSGGWDSRAIVSILRERGADMSLRVRGSIERVDVRLASELARIANLELRIKPHGGMPPPTLGGVRGSLTRALLWQGGGIDLKKHLTFQVRRGFSRSGVNVMGSHAGIGKADFAVAIGADPLAESEWEPALLEHFLGGMPIALRNDLRGPVRERILESIRVADRYDLEGLHKLHFLFLHEYTRRWAAGAINGAVDLVFTPFLNPDFIRAAYAFPPEEIPSRPFHSRVTGRFAPDWAGVPYENQLDQKAAAQYPPLALSKTKRKFVEEGSERWRPSGGKRLYHRKFFWRDVGKPLMDEAKEAEGSFAHQVFDRDLLRPNYQSSPDAIAIAYLLPTVLE